MLQGSPEHKELEGAIELHLAKGEVLSPSHAEHIEQCISCAQLFEGLAVLAERTPAAPAGLNQRVLRAVIADQEQIRSKADRREAAGMITLTTLRAALIILAVTVATFSAGVWAASNLGK